MDVLSRMESNDQRVIYDSNWRQDLDMTLTSVSGSKFFFLFRGTFHNQ